MLATNSPVLKILNEKIDVLTLSPTEKKLYESRMKLKSDIVSISNSQFNKGIEKGMEKGIEKGIEKGREEGIKEGNINTARRMKKARCEASFIMEMTGLTQEEIEKL